VAQALLSGALAPRRRTLTNRLIGMLARRARALWAAHGDPLIRYPIGGREMVMPLSSELPIIHARWTHYDTNLVRLAVMAAAGKRNAAIVDIGANVGDSTIQIRQALETPILCVEGDELFVDLLRHNLRDVPDVEVAEVFVAAAGDCGPGRPQSIRRQGGTAALIPSSAGLPLTRPVRSLAEILSAHQRFSAPGFIKIDTDGFDSQIIAGNRELLSRTCPVVFFEFDPFLAARVGDENPYRAIAALAEAGYEGALVYSNTGELILVARVTDAPLWHDLGRYALARPGHYYDVAAFHVDDLELYEQSAAAERRFFDQVALGA
jgi:FkbM family methyltransferase